MPGSAHRKHGTKVTVLTREKSFQDWDAVGERRLFLSGVATPGRVGHSNVGVANDLGSQPQATH